MPLPDRVVDEDGHVVFTAARTSPPGSRSSCAAVSRSTARSSGHGGYLGPTTPPTTCAGRATMVAQDSLEARGSTDPRAALVELMRTEPVRRGDRRPGVHRRAGVGLRDSCSSTTRTSSATDTTKYGLIPNAITDPDDIHDLTAFFSLDRLGRGRRATGPRLLLHQQLAGGAPGRQRADRRHRGLERPVAGRPARRDRRAVRGLRPVEPADRLAQRRAPALAFSSPARSQVTPAQKATAWFFFVVAALFLGQALLGAAVEHYRAELATSSASTSPGSCPTTSPGPGTSSCRCCWTAASFLAAGIFLAPYHLRSRAHEAALLAYGLLGAVGRSSSSAR